MGRNELKRRNHKKSARRDTSKSGENHSARARNDLWSYRFYCALVDIFITILKTFVRECCLIAAQLVELLCRLALHIVGADLKLSAVGADEEAEAGFGEDGEGIGSSQWEESEELSPRVSNSHLTDIPLEPIPTTPVPNHFAASVRQKVSRLSRLGLRLAVAPAVVSGITPAQLKGAHHLGGQSAPLKDRMYSGLAEDFIMTALVCIDTLGEALKAGSLRNAFTAFAPLLPWRLFAGQNVRDRVDCRTTAEVITSAGFPCEQVEILSADGYLLVAERLPQRHSPIVVYFQHGVMDSSYGWVCCGPDGSLGFLSYKAGYDTWLGNFRGFGSSYHPEKSSPQHGARRAPAVPVSSAEDHYNVLPRISRTIVSKRGTKPVHLHLSRSASARGSRDDLSDLASDAELEGAIQRVRMLQSQHAQRMAEYWDFSLNELAYHDVPAFINAIMRKKQAELPADSAPVQLFVVCHSLGAAAVLAYIAQCARDGVPSGIDGVIPMAPAGCHLTMPLFCKITGPLIYQTGTRLGIHHVRLAEWDWIRIVASKLLHDVLTHPGTRSFFVWLVHHALIGGAIATSPFQHMRNLTYNMSNAGVSFGIFKQFWMNFKQQRWGPMDLGPVGNAAQYGTLEAPSYLDWYKDIPKSMKIHFVAGKADSLIPVESVSLHVDAMRAAGLRPTMKVLRNLGHIDLTMGASAATNLHVMDVLLTWAPQAPSVSTDL